MLSNVVLYGVLGKKIGERGRMVKCRSIDPLHQKDNVFNVPVIYWTNSNMSNLLLTPKDDEKVIIRGRLDSCEEFPIYVVCEYIEIIK